MSDMAGRSSPCNFRQSPAVTLQRLQLPWRWLWYKSPVQQLLNITGLDDVECQGCQISIHLHLPLENALSPVRTSSIITPKLYTLLASSTCVEVLKVDVPNCASNGDIQP